MERCGKMWRSAREGAMRSWTDAPMRMLRYGTSRLPISPIVVRCQRSVDRVLVLLEKIRFAREDSEEASNNDDEGRSRWRHGGVKSR